MPIFPGRTEKRSSGWFVERGNPSRVMLKAEVRIGLVRKFHSEREPLRAAPIVHSERPGFNNNLRGAHTPL